MGMLTTFFGISREIRDQELPNKIFLENCKISWAIDLLFPDYHDRRTTKRTCSNVYIHSDFFIDINLAEFWINRFKIEKPWKGSAFMAATEKLYLLIRLTFCWTDGRM
ncbi:hypothetical protein T01_11645 [Trichinella spiralis]|uniref:Uncharacterized protein n=1 Tax=Trichinella spiralis TaxID=6334 RepID=A0A0V1AR05_TRISP|nr:hypothetical protein T01_11645 [Trichinella spiralis]